MPRQTKTPQQRAEEALRVASNKETKAVKRVQAAVVELDAANADLKAARERLGYAGSDPALPEQTRADIAEYLAPDA